MKTIKSYTDLEQSKKLAEILPLESADMFYNGVQDLDKETVFNIPIDGRTITVRTGHIITKEGIRANLLLPCWSLVALLGILKDYTMQTNTDGSVFVVCYSKKPMRSDAYDNPVDACVTMIEKLHELKML